MWENKEEQMKERHEGTRKKERQKEGKNQGNKGREKEKINN